MMQTFLPFPDFAASARVLDTRRLGKQRVETLQILRALHLQNYGWANHPAVTMWRGHTPALVAYGVAVVAEWTARGSRDATAAQIAEFVHPDPPATQASLAVEGRLPGWLGWPPLHRSHRSALRRKDPDHYGWQFPDTPDDLDYVWPDPPVARTPPGARSAWVVRSPVLPGEIRIAARPGEWPWTPLPGRSGRITKRLRQLAWFIDEMRPGDLVVVPDGPRLHLATIVGDHEHHEGTHVRPIHRTGELRRADLAFPAALQDPQDVFALVDEPAVTRVAGR